MSTRPDCNKLLYSVKGSSVILSVLYFGNINIHVIVVHFIGYNDSYKINDINNVVYDNYGSLGKAVKTFLKLNNLL